MDIHTHLGLLGGGHMCGTLCPVPSCHFQFWSPEAPSPTAALVRRQTAPRTAPSLADASGGSRTLAWCDWVVWMDRMVGKEDVAGVGAQEEGSGVEGGEVEGGGVCAGEVSEGGM